MGSGTLYLVATPIGNLEDLTLRALRVLRQVSRIACEDTRHTRKLLHHHQIATPTVSFHRFNEHQRLPRLLEQLLSGENLALVTDAGTPLISDPGYALVRACVGKRIPVVPVPGASALVCALIASGLPTERFLFLGFLPHRSAQRVRFLEQVKEEVGTLVFFDSPRRLKRTLMEMKAVLGNRRAALCREMTKVHEEYRHGSIESLAESLSDQVLKGEVTLVVDGAAADLPAPLSAVGVRRQVEEAMRKGLSRRDAVRDVARRIGARRNDVYRLARPTSEEAPNTGTDEEE